MHCDKGLRNGINALRQITFASGPDEAYSRATFGPTRTKGDTMKTLISAAAVIALGLAAGGCSVLETKSMAHEDLKNAQGHVVGYKDTVREQQTGEEMSQIALFVPRFSDSGKIIGYEERVRGGSILRDLNGRKIGGRWLDVRSGKGLVIVVRGKDSAERVAMAQAPSIEDLIQLARLTN